MRCLMSESENKPKTRTATLQITTDRALSTGKESMNQKTQPLPILKPSNKEK